MEVRKNMSGIQEILYGVSVLTYPGIKVNAKL